MRRFALAALLVIAPGCADRAKQTMLLYGLGEYAGAAHAADEALAKHPDDHDLWAWRVRAALALGDAQGVAGSYATYLTHRDGDDKELLRDLATATLGQALASPSSRLKILAIEAIEDLQVNALADRVAERLGDEDDRVAAAAAIAVIHGFSQAPGVADEMMRSENVEARRIAVDGVGKKVGKIAAADLEKAGDDNDARVRAAAIHWLGVMKDADAVELCTRRLRRDPDEEVRAAAASALARIGIGNLEALGKIALKDKALAVRLAGLELLAAARRDDELVALVDDPDPILALHAAIVIKQTHPELATKATERAITSEVPSIRGAAADLLIDAVGKTAAIPFARRLTTDKEPGVQLRAAIALVHAGDPEAARKLLEAAYQTNLDAIITLAQFDSLGTNELGKMVRDLSIPAEDRAIAATAHRTAHRVTPSLVAALADPNGLVRVAAATAIGALAK